MTNHLRLLLAELLKATEGLRDTPEHSADDISDEAQDALVQAEAAIDKARAELSMGDY